MYLFPKACSTKVDTFKKKKKKNICRVEESKKKPFTLQERWYPWHKMKWISNDQNRDYLPNFKEEKSHISPKAFKIQEAQVTCNTLNELIHSDQEQFPFTTEVKTYSISLNSLCADRRCIVDIVSCSCANQRCIVDIVSRSCASRRCIVDMRNNVSFATGGPDMILFKFPMGDNSKWKSCLLRKCLFLIVIILRSIIIAFFFKEKVGFHSKQTMDTPMRWLWCKYW